MLLASQDELAERLSDLGFAVTQATISRDLEQIGAVKVRRDGELAYALPDQVDARHGRPAPRNGLPDWVQLDRCRGHWSSSDSAGFGTSGRSRARPVGARIVRTISGNNQDLHTPARVFRCALAGAQIAQLRRTAAALEFLPIALAMGMLTRSRSALHSCRTMFRPTKPTCEQQRIVEAQRFAFPPSATISRACPDRLKCTPAAARHNSRPEAGMFAREPPPA